MDKPGRRRKEQVYTVQGTPGQAREEEEGAGIHCKRDSWKSQGGGGRIRYTLYEGLLDKSGRRRKEQVYTVLRTPGPGHIE